MRASQVPSRLRYFSLIKRVYRTTLSRGLPKTNGRPDRRTQCSALACTKAETLRSRLASKADLRRSGHDTSNS